MGKKVRWFDAVQRILSTSEPDREEKEDKKAERPTSKLNFKKLWQFGKSSTSSSNSSSSAAPETAPAAHPQPPPPSPSRPDRQKAVEVTEATSTGTASEQNDGRYHVRTAEAVVCATSTVTPRALDRSEEEVAAVRIQTACRGYLARRVYRRARAQSRLMSLLEGIAVRRQTEEALYCMQTMTRVQTQIYSRRLKTEEDKKALRSQIQLKQALDKTKIGEGWDHSHQSKEQMEATLAMKQEAASRRQKALSYAFSRQWRNRNPASSSSGRASPTQSNPPMYMDPGCPNWGWSWSERWIAAARPWECQTAPQPDKDKDRAPATPKTPGRAAKPRVSISIQIPTTPTGRSPRLPSPSTPTRPRSPSVLGKTITPPARLPSPRGSPLHRSVTLLSERPRSSQEHLGSGGMEAALRRTTSMRSGETPRRINVRARDADTGETGGAPVTPSYMQQTKSVKAKARCASPIAADRADLTVRVRPVSSPSVQRRMPVEFAEKPGASSSPRTPSNSKAKPEVRAKRPPSPRFLV
ncbi:protein IQ-DOMAIN 3-like [Lolium rigidum]|uniref:protein IQ-DOMAIN 3-like n=1 Tax=Lolium rigidum TaxID=89674 RepID=UPI001F5DC8C3|nr:protein IQ-DOMAIN 3-like [Lolium rigidum]